MYLNKQIKNNPKKHTNDTSLLVVTILHMKMIKFVEETTAIALPLGGALDTETCCCFITHMRYYILMYM